MIKQLWNASERATYKLLLSALKAREAFVLSKTRLTDVLDVDLSGSTVNEKNYYFTTHFDFVVTDAEGTPSFAIEFDGSAHFNAAARFRDDLKNKLCAQELFPLARIRQEHLVKESSGQLDLIRWLVECFFAHKILQEAQNQGTFPADEPIDVSLISGIPGLKGEFPLWLSRTPRIQVQKLFAQGRVASQWYDTFGGRYWSNWDRCLAWIYLAPDQYAAATGTIYLDNFGLLGMDAAEDIALMRLCTLVTKTPEGNLNAKQLRAKIIRFLSEVEFGSQGSCGANRIPFSYSFTGREYVFHAYEGEPEVVITKRAP